MSNNGMCPPHVYKGVKNEHGRIVFICKYCKREM